MNRVLGWSIVVASAALLALLSSLIIFRPGEGSAYHSSGLHLSTMHIAHFYNDEDFCALIEDGSMSHSTARNRIRNTLYIDNPSYDWDGLAGDKVYFLTEWDPCNQASCRSCIEIEYWVRSSGCGGGTSCQWFTNYLSSHDGANDYRYSYVRFKTSHINGSSALYHHVINHESGHFLGLKDPNYYGHCTTSVMHSKYYGCSQDREWPTSGDRTKVTNIANKTQS